ncbi:MAG: LuxR C-terminal-related transcriptional regulator [Cyanobacteria bacterium P01_D01_bin.156]
MTLPAIKPNLENLYAIPAIANIADQGESRKHLETQFLAELHQEFLDGILVFTEQGDLIYSNRSACNILDHFHQEPADEIVIIPEEILHICQSLIHSRAQFPHQNWLVELDIVTQDSVILHIRARWLKTNLMESPCLLLVLEDRQQAIVHIAMEEAQQYGLTSREKEVWMLHRNDLTYKQIAVELGITPHTVKKHMKNIHSKQKDSTLGTANFSNRYTS